MSVFEEFYHVLELYWRLFNSVNIVKLMTFITELIGLEKRQDAKPYRIYNAYNYQP
jgi:hypothetical protein